VSVTIRRTALAKRRLGRSELKLFSDWNDGRPSSTSNSIARQRTRSLASQMERRCSFTGSFNRRWEQERSRCSSRLHSA
jgi:hypothetical protein